VDLEAFLEPGRVQHALDGGPPQERPDLIGRAQVVLTHEPEERDPGTCLVKQDSTSLHLTKITGTVAYPAP
jgi:hypothetical protein